MVSHLLAELITTLWVRGSVYRSGSGYQIGVGDQAVGWLAKGTEESVLQV